MAKKKTKHTSPLWAAFVLIALLTSCTTTRWVNTGGYWLESVDTPDSVPNPTLSDDGVYADDDMTIKLEMLDDCFALRLANRSGGPIRIVWRESSYTDELGEEHPLKHTEATDYDRLTQHATTIASGTTLEDFVAPADKATVGEDGTLQLTPLWDIYHYSKKAEAEQMRPDSSYVTVTLAIQNGADISKYHFDFAGTDYETHKVREANEFGQLMSAVLIPFGIDLSSTLIIIALMSVIFE